MSHAVRQQRRPIRPAKPVSPVKVTIAVVGSIVALIVLFAGGIAAEQYTRRQPAAATSPPVQVVKAGPGLGNVVRDGKLEFVVSRMDCSRTTIGVEHLRRSAQGRFCVISLSVRNIGDGAKLFVGHAQLAYDASGTEYHSDQLAGIYANRGTEAFLERLQPGEKVAGKIVFDVPKKAKLTTLKLRDSLLSGGAEIALG
ncbi:DUF4352 domain-containing protein [Actinoplanes oblitus]|uniref:DUF4352 domain-containing protein n=1 Tax=Actinoplanes oblitus TaxID=3040509 RepID=A0ABY8WW24_9ACTN|nr:DUF4352 domain-containing protein [Actinoplanes oblitus]WIN00351.1 DUF4352 domain-containing protein [Actinoplanes oblitus]